jgi:hypothetical protein
VVGQERRRVLEVALVDLHHLQLGQQQVGQRERARLERHAVGELERVAQHHAVDEDVELALVAGVPEQQALAPVQRVELPVGLVAQLLQGLRQRPDARVHRGQVEVLVVARQRRPGGGRAAQLDAEPSHRARRDLEPLELVQDARRLLAQIGERPGQGAEDICAVDARTRSLAPRIRGASTGVPSIRARSMSTAARPV